MRSNEINTFETSKRKEYVHREMTPKTNCNLSIKFNLIACVIIIIVVVSTDICTQCVIHRLRKYNVNI
jgi:hypothetical protein